jgi:hypothetical protein
VTDYRHEIRALIDPEQSDPLPGGGRLQDITIVMTDPPSDGRALPPAAVTLLACQARELAFELLVLAEHADRQRTHPDTAQDDGGQQR